MQLILNNVKYTVNAKSMPWKGAIEAVNTIAQFDEELQAQRFKNNTTLDMEDITVRNVLTFCVVCSSASPEPGRRYVVNAQADANNVLTIGGYSC